MLTEHIKARLKSDTWGNYLFWITFCIVGQPVSVLTYYHDWVVINRGLAPAQAASVAAA